MIRQEDVAEVGKIFKPHGYKGEMNVDILYGPELFDEPKTHFFVKIDNILVPFFVEKIGGGATGTAHLKFKGIDSDTEAAKFARKEIYTLRNVLSGILGLTEEELDQNIAGFAGYEVTDGETNELIGVVEDIEEGIEYDYLIVVRPSGETIQIPLIDEFVEGYEPPQGDGKGKITVKLPEGFLEI